MMLQKFSKPIKVFFSEFDTDNQHTGKILEAANAMAKSKLLKIDLILLELLAGAQVISFGLVARLGVLKKLRLILLRLIIK